MYNQSMIWLNLLVLFLVFEFSFENKTTFKKDVNRQFIDKNDQRSSVQEKPKENLDEPMISMASNIVPKYFSNQQKAYHQKFDRFIQPNKKPISNKPKLGQQISLNHHSYNNVAESVEQSSSILFGGNFHNEFDKKYPYTPKFLRFNPSDGRSEIDTKPSLRISSRIDNWKNDENYVDKKYTKEFKSNLFQSKPHFYQSKPNAHQSNNHQPNYNVVSNKKYELVEEQNLPVVKEPQIEYSKHPVALPLYSNSNYQPPVNKPTYSTTNRDDQYDQKYKSSNQPAITYTSPPYFINEPIDDQFIINQPVVNYPANQQTNYQANPGNQKINHPNSQQIDYQQNYRANSANQRPNYKSKPKYVIEHKPVSSSAYSSEDKSLEETIADLPNILAKTLPGLIPVSEPLQNHQQSHYQTVPVNIDTSKSDYKSTTNTLKPVQILVQMPKHQLNEEKYLPPYLMMSKDQNLKETEETHKNHQYDSHLSTTNRDLNNNYNRLHKNEYYSNNGYQSTSHYVQSNKEVQPYTTYMNNSELNDYESSIYSETRYVDEQVKKQNNKTKNYYLVYKLDDKRLENELKHINHHLTNAEERINNPEDDYHDVINLTPIFEDGTTDGDGLEKLFTIDSMNTVMKNGKNEQYTNEEYVIPSGLHRSPIRTLNNNKRSPNDYGPKKVYPSNRDKFTAEDGKDISHAKYGQPSNYEKLNYNRPPIQNYKPRVNENLDFVTDSAHYTPDLKRISSSIRPYNLTGQIDYKNNSTIRPKNRLFIDRSIDYSPSANRYEPERTDHERIYLFANKNEKLNLDNKSKFDQNNYAKNSDFNKKEYRSDKPEYRSEYKPEYKTEYKPEYKANYKTEYKPDYKSDYKLNYKPGEFVQESFKSKSEFNDQTHKKETSVLVKTSYDDYLHANYGKADQKLNY